MVDFHLVSFGYSEMSRNLCVRPSTYVPLRSGISGISDRLKVWPLSALLGYATVLHAQGSLKFGSNSTLWQTVTRRWASASSKMSEELIASQ